jgi:hypothetical protein
MAEFNSSLSCTQITDKVWRINLPLIYQSDLIKEEIVVPSGFCCDFESVPRLPIVYMCLGHTSFRGGAVHDYLYRSDCSPCVTRAQADAIYREISVISAVQYLLAEGKEPTAIQMARIHSQACAKWAGVRAGGWRSYHKKSIHWKPDCISEA